jgi:hypothetical protein
LRNSPISKKDLGKIEMNEEQYQTPEWIEILRELIEKAKKNKN